MYLLPDVKDWPQLMYLVMYLHPSNEENKITCEIVESDMHVVHFLGNPDAGFRGMPRESPIFKLAYVCKKDLKIIFQDGPERCDAYTATLDGSYLARELEVFEDGSCSIDALGCPRKLTEESWERVLSKSQEWKRSLSFQCK